MKKLRAWFLSRTSILVIAAALAGAATLAACNGDDSKQVTVADIVAAVQKACNFKTTADQILPVVVAVVAGFNPSAGAAATVAASVGDQIATRVCDAVRSAPPKAAPGANAEVPITVVVNGVPVSGTIVR